MKGYHVYSKIQQFRSVGLSQRQVAPREYEAVPELPMGQQMQVDFWQKVMPNVDGGQTRVYVAAFVLSRSRYKCAGTEPSLYQDRPCADLPRLFSLHGRDAGRAGI